MGLKFKITGSPDWEAKQHARHLCHKLKKSQLDQGMQEEPATIELLKKECDKKFQDVITKHFSWYWEPVTAGDVTEEDSGQGPVDSEDMTLDSEDITANNEVEVIPAKKAGKKK